VVSPAARRVVACSLADATTIGSQTELSTHPIYYGYDVALTVYPARGSSPCPDLAETLEPVLPVGFTGGIHETCVALPYGRWQDSSEYDDQVTQIERVNGFFIALTVNTQTARLVKQFRRLFAGLHHPNTDELVAIGLSDFVPSPVE
jgi:hypothetical protein